MNDSAIASAKGRRISAQKNVVAIPALINPRSAWSRSAAGAGAAPAVAGAPAGGVAAAAAVAAAPMSVRQLRHASALLAVGSGVCGLVQLDLPWAANVGIGSGLSLVVTFGALLWWRQGSLPRLSGRQWVGLLGCAFTMVYLNQIAFAAGLVLSESIYSHRIMADIMPFKDLFLTIFFVSVGLMIDVGALVEQQGHGVALEGHGLVAVLVAGLVGEEVAHAQALPAREGQLGERALARQVGQGGAGGAAAPHRAHPGGGPGLRGPGRTADPGPGRDQRGPAEGAGGGLPAGLSPGRAGPGADGPWCSRPHADVPPVPPCRQTPPAPRRPNEIIAMPPVPR